MVRTDSYSISGAPLSKKEDGLVQLSPACTLAELWLLQLAKAGFAFNSAEEGLTVRKANKGVTDELQWRAKFEEFKE